MSIIIKTESEIKRLRKGGKVIADILRKVAKKVAPGITTGELNDYAHDLIIKAGHKPAFLGYQPHGQDYPYPASLITSVNAEVVHGVPGKKVLKEGDIIALDLGLNYEGVILDHAITVPVGGITTPKDKELIAVTEQALYKGIEAIVPGATVGDIGHAIESFIKPYKLGIVRVLSGHGVGREIHEDPYVPNYGRPGKGAKLVPGMVIAIEPMITRGSEEVVTMRDGYTLKTADNSRSAHFEHTVLITEKGAEILTK
ncbi:MAG: type I methionyl aminopeptidase [Patescibacteria group bacterium]